MDIAAKMRELIEATKDGYKGAHVPLKPELEADWTADYAIVEGFYPDPPFLPDNDFVSFDSDGYLTDFEVMVERHFGPGIYPVRNCKLVDTNFPVGSVLVRFYRESQEIEVYRVQPTLKQA